MSAHHWIRFNVGDYLADTMHLSALQHGIYFLLIMHYFMRGGLPDGEAGLARIAKVSTRIFHEKAGPVMALFRRENGEWHHRRIEEERARARGDQPTTPTRARQNQRTKESPRSPPNGGQRGRAYRNGFEESAVSEMMETDHADPADPPADRATVVAIPRRANGR